jgi:hypothetical protein
MAVPGSITVAADPVVPLGIATKQYLDTAVAGAAGAPADPVFNLIVLEHLAVLPTLLSLEEIQMLLLATLISTMEPV